MIGSIRTNSTCRPNAFLSVTPSPVPVPPNEPKSRLLQQVTLGHRSQAFDLTLDALPALTPLRATTPVPQHFDLGNLPSSDELRSYDFSSTTQSPNDFATHADQLRQSLEQAGLVSCPASPRFAQQYTPIQTPMVPFMGHAATAPNSPTGLRAFMELD